MRRLSLGLGNHEPFQPSFLSEHWPAHGGLAFGNVAGRVEAISELLLRVSIRPRQSSASISLQANVYLD